ncbi:MAG: hypothetical protein IPK58_09810 [Acidobacteria bacterium]|nr:hypothetical protein [Acidobacteriota bacterium]
MISDSRDSRFQRFQKFQNWDISDFRDCPDMRRFQVDRVAPAARHKFFRRARLNPVLE